jgi:hypothetical protein
MEPIVCHYRNIILHGGSTHLAMHSQNVFLLFYQRERFDTIFRNERHLFIVISIPVM